MTKYSYSTDEERYHGQQDSIDDAVQEAFSCYGLCEGDTIHIGANVAPPPPEDAFFANDWLEQVSCQDEYSGEWAEDWCGETKEQREELEAAVRKVMADWLDRHKLRPQFWNTEYIGRYTIEGGKVVKR